jgi:4-hydroxy-tetrahydrodipicolinate synthase
MKFHGVMTAIVTPMQQGCVDEAGLRQLIRTQLVSGVTGVITCGSTGEGATLSLDEQEYVASIAVDESMGRIAVVAGIGSRSTHGALTLAERLRDSGVNGLLVVTPAYNKPTAEGLELHFLTLAENTNLPICLYNVPSRTGVDLKTDSVARLAEHPRIVAIKEATGSLVRATELRAACPSDFALLTGDDGTTLPFMAQGGDGCISVLSNVVPAQVVEMLAAVTSGKIERAGELHHRLAPLTQALFCESNPIPVKTACAWLSLIPTAELRLPLTPLSKAGQAQLEACITDLGLRPMMSTAPASTLGPGEVPSRENAEACTVEYDLGGNGEINP